MDGNHQIALHIQEVFQNLVTELRCQDLEKADPAELFPHAKIPGTVKVKGAGSNKVFGAQTGFVEPFPVKEKGLRGVHAQNVMEHPEPLLTGEGFSHNPHAFEIVQDVRFQPFQPGLGCFDGIGINAKGEVLGFHQAVVAPGQLVLQHLGILLPDGVKFIPLVGNLNAVHEGILRSGEVQEGQLEADGGIEVIEKVAPAVKDGLLVLIVGELIVDVPELDGFGEMGGCDLADAVRAEHLVGYAGLCGLALFIRSPGSFDCGLYRFPFGQGQLFGGQCGKPPCLIGLAAAGRRRNYWSDRGASLAGAPCCESCSAE